MLVVKFILMHVLEKLISLKDALGISEEYVIFYKFVLGFVLFRNFVLYRNL